MRIAGYETHPAADLFPMMEGADLKALADDIKAHGLHNPVVLFAEGGKRLVLDGRNRLKACEMAGVSVTTEFWAGDGSPTDWVVSQNLHRRHLTTSQKAMVAADLSHLYEQEAKERQRIGGEKKGTANLREASGTSAAKAASAMGVSERIVESALKVQREAPMEVVAAVRSGDVTVHAAEQAVANPPPRGGSIKDHLKDRRGTMWRVPRSPRALAQFLRQHWTTKEWRDFMRAAESEAA